MNGLHFFDRRSRKTLDGLIACHLQHEYHLPPRAAQTLSEDALVFGRLWGRQTRAPGQILFHAVRNVLANQDASPHFPDRSPNLGK